MGINSVDMLSEGCPLRGVDYGVEENEVLLTRGSVVVDLVKHHVGGVDLDLFPDDAFDGHNPIQNDVVPAAKLCAQRIVAGECSRYIADDNGDIQSREPEETSVDL